VAGWRRRIKARFWPEAVLIRHLFLLLLAAIVIAVLTVVTVRALGGSRGLQVVLSLAGFSGLVLFVLWDEEIGLVEGLGVTAALIGLGGALIAGLVFLGSIEPVPATGCVISDGRNEATISATNTSIYSEADHASAPTGLLLEGCTIHYDDYCIGTVQTDAQFSGVKDSRWLKLGEDELVPSAHTVGVVPDGSPSNCPGEKKPPDRIVFRKATLSGDGLLALDATAPRAAVVGFALEREDGSWLRLGWDPSPSDANPEVFVAPAIARPGDRVFATACTGFEGPIGPTRRLRLTAGKVVGDPDPFHQPTHPEPADAACDAGVAKE
jgi:hypothetical protein